MKDVKNANKDALKGVKTVIFDLDGTIYDKSGLAKRMVSRLWWCLPFLAAERLARRNMHYVQFATEEDFYRAFFKTMARGHFWGRLTAATWYVDVYLPTMVRLIHRYHKPRPKVMALIEQCKARGLQMAIYSDYGAVAEKLYPTAGQGSMKEPAIPVFPPYTIPPPTHIAVTTVYISALLNGTPQTSMQYYHRLTPLLSPSTR